MTPAIRAELLFDEREVVVSALNRTMLIDPDSSTQRYLNNPSGYAMWDVNKHRNSHLQASWVYQRQFYTVFPSACRKILYSVFYKVVNLAVNSWAFWGSFHTYSWDFHLLPVCLSLKYVADMKFRIQMWMWRPLDSKCIHLFHWCFWKSLYKEFEALNQANQFIDES